MPGNWRVRRLNHSILLKIMENGKMNNLTSIVAFSALSTQHQKEHRAKIGVRAESILLNFWREDGVSDVVRICEIQGWIDMLETCSHSEVRAAWTEYQRYGPRNSMGRLLKPDAGALWQIVMKSRPRPKPAPIMPRIAEAPRIRMTAERAAEIIREVNCDREATSEPQNGALGTFVQEVLQGYGQEPEARL